MSVDIDERSCILEWVGRDSVAAPMTGRAVRVETNRLLRRR